MKRLTSNDYNSCFDCNYHSGCSYIKKVNPLVCSERERYDRLAVIEDILGDEYELDRLRELVKADKEGRCVVLPCKEGDTVWRIGHDAIEILAGIHFMLAADVAPVRHGRWMDAESDNGCTLWHCSICSYPVKTIGGYPIYKYCPMCGALMDGKEDEHVRNN